MVRAAGPHLLGRDSERHTAFAAESVADEVVFVTGPALVTFLATAFAPQAGLVDGRGRRHGRGRSPWRSQRRTEPPAHPHDPTDGPEPDAVGDCWCR